MIKDLLTDFSLEIKQVDAWYKILSTPIQIHNWLERVKSF